MLVDLKARIEELEKAFNIEEEKEPCWWPVAYKSLSKEEKRIMKEANEIFDSAEKKVETWMSKPDSIRRKSPFYNEVMDKVFHGRGVEIPFMTKEEVNIVLKASELMGQLTRKYDPSYTSFRSSIH